MISVESSKTIEGTEYVTKEEATRRYGWGTSTLYYFIDLGYLKNYKFLGDKRRFYAVPELEAIKNRPPEVTKTGPKSMAVALETTATR